MFSSYLISLLKRGGIAVIPTDTLYGIVADARNQRAVARLYALRRERARKPFIILASSISDLRLFDVVPTARQIRFLRKVWPGKVSVVLPCPSKRFAYLHLGTNALAFRLPKKKTLQAFLKKTGPLVAPSANLPGQPPAGTSSEAKAYFKDRVDCYVSAKRRVSSEPSTLVRLNEDGTAEVLRQGAVKISFRR